MPSTASAVGGRGAELGRVIKGQDYWGGVGTSVFSPCQACVFEFCKLSSVLTEFCEKTRSPPGTSFDRFKVFGFLRQKPWEGLEPGRVVITYTDSAPRDPDSPLKPNSQPIAAFHWGLLRLPLSKLLSDRYLKWHQHPAPPSNLASFLFFLARPHHHLELFIYSPISPLPNTSPPTPQRSGPGSVGSGLPAVSSAQH